MSTTTSENNKRIAKNTLLLYIRTVFTMLISLYTSRVILQALGVVDYGIYSVVGGFVAMFAVLSNSLSAAISRFITYELGKGDKTRLNLIFCTSLKVQIYLSLIIFVIAETVGLWFLNTKMVFPLERLWAVNWIYQFSIVTFIVNLISVPYNACIVAHEHMKAFAYFGIFQSLLALVVAFMIQLSSFDKLIYYSILMTGIALIIRLAYGIYCERHFDECHFLWKTDRGLTKEITGFAGWNFIGAASGVLRDQGINVVLNIFCGPVINAARGIAMQVSHAVMSFSSNFTTAINPQITKSFAANEREYTMKLVFQGARLSFYLLFLMSLPVIMETPYLLKIWLGEVPEHTVNFVRLILLYVLTESLSYTMVTLMLATGDIKKYQIIVGGCQMLNLPVAYLLMRLGFAPEATVVGSIVIALLCLASRLYMLHGMVGFPVRYFLKNVFVNVLLVSLLSILLPVIIIRFYEEGLLRFFLSCSVCIFSSVFVMLFIGCTIKERKFIMEKIKCYIFKR